MAAALWLSGLHPAPTRAQLSRKQLLRVLPLAAVHTLGNLLTNVSLGRVAVSFTHTVKATEPFFSVLFSWLLMGSRPDPRVLAALVPIFAGVALASATEASFNWPGFAAAMGSNLTFQSRNVLSKMVMGRRGAGDPPPLDNVNLFSVITALSALLCLPLTAAVEGLALPAEPAVLWHALYAGLCFHAYQQLSYMILQRVSPVTHSVGNCVKRVVVIASSIAFFGTPVSSLNAAGTALALAGVFAYSQIQSRAKMQPAIEKPAVPTSAAVPRKIK